MQKSRKAISGFQPSSPRMDTRKYPLFSFVEQRMTVCSWKSLSLTVNYDFLIFLHYESNKYNTEMI